MLDAALGFLVTFLVMCAWGLSALVLAIAYRVLVDWIGDLRRHGGPRRHA